MREGLHGRSAPPCDYTAPMRIPCPSPLRATLFVALSLAVLVPAHAQWMWRDKDGRVTASDLPPPRDIAERDILQRPDLTVRKAAAPAPAASAAVPAKPAVDPQLEARRRASEQEQQAKAKADDERLAAQRAENCRRARSHVSALDSGQRLARTTGTGEREILDDKGRAEEMRRDNEVIASDFR